MGLDGVTIPPQIQRGNLRRLPTSLVGTIYESVLPCIVRDTLSLARPCVSRWQDGDLEREMHITLVPRQTVLHPSVTPDPLFFLLIKGMTCEQGQVDPPEMPPITSQRLLLRPPEIGKRTGGMARHGVVPHLTPCLPTWLRA